MPRTIFLPEETLFIICSKAFATRETLTNTHTAREWSLSKLGTDTANMFGFWGWVHVRYSMDFAIGPSTMIAVGSDNMGAILDRPRGDQNRPPEFTNFRPHFTFSV